MAKKYYELTPDERLAFLNLSDHVNAELQANQSDNNAQIIENYISDFRVPMGLLKDIIIDAHSVNVPMAIEEPSVIAAANNGAKLLNSGGGVVVKMPERTAMIGQILFHGVNFHTLNQFVKTHQEEIFDIAKRTKPSIYKRGGGLVAINIRQISDDEMSVDFKIDTKDAMGANIVNTILEAEISLFSEFDKHILGAILTNYAMAQLVTVIGNVTFEAVGGREIAEKIVALNRFSKNDSYRAVTENKGLFNGIGAVVLATGNDWRAVEASGHAYASQNGHYRSLTHWTIIDEQLHGELTLPISVGTVGGVISAMNQAKNVLDIIHAKSADELRGIILAVGLAQNLAALKAIADGGIQRGHMRMQYRALAVQVGALPQEVPILVSKLNTLAQVDEARATEILMEMRK
ncbi:hydroxymethylglutaryl-CoA reductase, degradative [Leuconostoc gelidum]|uniref:hydroxymethylglutaryl-CoA reductase, degradative n=1 Tax=Leuconostoc gelidum TaxID=1244 RepID=UPI0002191F8E|nr:hydroxymethylglutaryl-CoA reductase, degradative [Leuconostoc gelidum]AFS41006.1 hydroxymethylglutaryl-CoA reductase [Leuconostoc gelidum JB7]MBZ5992869.1 hydroxymethylglutaryl-CoA reductase, degradative [Leuconostoc gelidum subsp. gelidum]USP17603.1 hydroxymethylglutaryl-CoA reductase, degradative [Leuconostoc gelidum subsp. aenigmaticum]GMA67590.1 3-hydroxy-3-methylglutaryl coenzyme A reductase [Leuconostoc gelidum subsp. gelidum]